MKTRTTKLKAAAVGEAPLTVVAVDLYGNASEPSRPLKRKVAAIEKTKRVSAGLPN